VREYWNCYWTCQEGEYHRKQKLKCQDRTAYKEKGSRQAIAMVDGVGKTNWNPIAGEQIANTVAEFLLEYFDAIPREMTRYMGQILIKKIYDIIFKMMNAYQQPASEFNFTLLGACIDHESGKYCAIHLGDGAIVCGGETNRIVSYPFHGERENETCLVLSDQVLKYLKFHSGDMKAMGYLALCTDGAYENGNNLKEVFTKIRELRERNSLKNGMDDMGIIVLESRLQMASFC